MHGRSLSGAGCSSDGLPRGDHGRSGLRLPRPDSGQSDLGPLGLPQQLTIEGVSEQILGDASRPIGTFEMSARGSDRQGRRATA